MVILIDTNIVLDVIQGRKPYCEVAADIFTLCAMKKVTGYIALHSVSNIFYIYNKNLDYIIKIKMYISNKKYNIYNNNMKHKRYKNNTRYN